MPLSLQNDLFHLTNRSTILHVFLTSPMHAACPARLVYLYLNILICHMPIPVPARSKAWVCGRPPAETVGSNTTGDMEVYLLWALGIVSATGWSLVQRVLLIVVRYCVWSRNLVNEEAMAQCGLSCQKQTKLYVVWFHHLFWGKL
jgi:hypothetical protein